MTPRVRPSHATSRRCSAGTPRTRGRQIAMRITAASATRSAEAPAGPISSNSFTAKAAPNCTDAAAAMTSSGAGTPREARGVCAHARAGSVPRMDTRALGTQGLRVSAMGLGCMGMSAFYGDRDDAESLRTLERALELGVTFLDTSDMYGPHTNEQLLGRFLAEGDRRDRVQLATKFGIKLDPSDPAKRGVDGSPAYVRECIEASLRRLGTDHVDLYYQ